MLKRTWETGREHGPVNRENIDHLLLEKLPDVLTEKERKEKIDHQRRYPLPPSMDHCADRRELTNKNIVINHRNLKNIG